MSLNQILLYPIGTSGSCRYASDRLEKAGIRLIDHPAPEITHVLLDIPSFDAWGLLKDGRDFKGILRMLPHRVTVIGGNLYVDYLKEYPTMDLLQDPRYLARNAAITAQCALQAAAPHLHTAFADTPVLILGWGRIGKCLANLLKAYGAPVTVAARKPQDRAMLEALGYYAVDFEKVPEILAQYRLLYNTVPDLPFIWDLSKVVAIDLASEPGMQGDNVIIARGLPGKYAPESSGRLMAETILRYYKEGLL